MKKPGHRSLWQGREAGSNETYTMNTIASLGGEQHQNGEVDDRDGPKWPTARPCAYAASGKTTPFVLRRKGPAGGAAQHVVVKLKCKCWSCPGCRVRKAKGWHSRIAAYLTTAFAEGRVPFVMGVAGGDWKAVSKRFARADARYCSIRPEGGSEAGADANGRTVIGAALPDRMPAGATAVTAAEAFDLLDRYAVAVANRTFEKFAGGGRQNRPMSACRAWKKADEEKEYVMVGRAPRRDPVELKSFLNGHRIDCRTVQTDDGWVMRFVATERAVGEIFYNREVKDKRQTGTPPPFEGTSMVETGATDADFGLPPWEARVPGRSYRLLERFRGTIDCLRSPPVEGV